MVFQKNSRYDLTNHELLSYRVIVCTLVTSGRIVSSGVPRGHFSHIFIDEANRAVEPECLIPITGLFHPGICQVVLAGDPQQLGPVLQSQIAIQHGLQVSLLERLMKRDVYQRHGDSFDPIVITKLLENYHSHPAILHEPNRMFYENELVACGNPILLSKMCTWKGLVKQGFPLVFHGVVGEENQEDDSPTSSFFNPEEVILVSDYVKRLKETRGLSRLIIEKDVGIITPYRKQAEKIKRCLEKQRLDDIMVGSEEEFQNQERTVILISTVRSNSDFLEIDQKFMPGLLESHKRFNVAVTRAKALLIVIGNPHLLMRVNHWKQFIEYIHSNGGYTGCPYPDQDLNENTIMENLQKLQMHREDAYQAAAAEQKS
jgi:helicase MOV-10